jgi:hypothetical protein
MIKEEKLLKIEVVFDIKKEDIVVDNMCTELFKSMIEETNLEEETVIAVSMIETIIKELFSKINDNIGEKKEEK